MNHKAIDAVYDRYRMRQVSDLPDNFEPFLRSLANNSQIIFRLGKTRCPFIVDNIQRTGDGNFIVNGQRFVDEDEKSELCMYVYAIEGFVIEVYDTSSSKILREIARIGMAEDENRAWEQQMHLRP